MKTRTYSWPEGHWDWYRHLAFKHGIEVGELMFVGGQVDKTPQGAPLNAFDLERQTERVIRHIDTVLAGFGSGLADVVKLTALYANDGSVDEAAFVADVGRRVIEVAGESAAGPVITPIPLPCLALPGMMVEIAAVAVRGAAPRTRANPPGLPPLPAPFCHGLRCGAHAWIGAQAARDAAGSIRYAGDALAQTPVVLDHLRAVLDALGLDLGDVVKLGCWYAGDGSLRSWAPAAQARARAFSAPGPVNTELPTQRLPAGETARVDAWAMAEGERRAVGASQGPIALPYSSGLRCGDMVFTAGHLPMEPGGEVVHAGDLNAQTRWVMEATRRTIAEFDLGLDHMVTQYSFYLGGADTETIVSNQTLRAAYYTEPAGASTGVPMPFFAIEDVMITVETIAMLD